MTRPKEEWVRVEGMHEAIVSKEEFRRGQEMVGAQKPAAGSRGGEFEERAGGGEEGEAEAV